MRPYSQRTDWSEKPTKDIGDDSVFVSTPSTPQSFGKGSSSSNNFDYTTTTTTSSTTSKSKLPAFSRLLRLSILVLRFSGFFPLNSQKKLDVKNVFSLLIMAFVGGCSLYMMIVKGLRSFLELFTNWSVDITVICGICCCFYLTFTCLVFVVGLGYYQKLERFSELLSNATNQKGLENNFTAISRKLRISQYGVIVIAVSALITYLCAWSIDSVPELIAAATNIYKNVFGDSWPAHLAASLFIPLGYLVLFQSVVLYWVCCKSLRIEFEQVNKDISSCDLRNAFLFNEIAMKHCRLLKCLNYLHHFVASYVMFVFAIGSLMSTLFAYVLLLNDADAGYRMLSFYWLCLTASMTSVLCLSAEGLHKAMRHAADRACSKVAESSKEHSINNRTYSIANMICKQASVDLGITAFGFFTVSKGLLLTIYSFIATYVVILLQTPSSTARSETAGSNSSSLL